MTAFNEQKISVEYPSNNSFELVGYFLKLVVDSLSGFRRKLIFVMIFLINLEKSLYVTNV